MDKYSSVLMLLALFSSAAEAKNFLSQLLATDQMSLGDYFFSQDWTCMLSMDQNNLNYFNKYIKGSFIPCANAVGLKMNSYGQMRIVTSTLKDCLVGPPSAFGTYSLVLGNDCVLKSVDGYGKTVAKFGTNVTNMIWAYSAITRQNSWTSTWDTPTSSRPTFSFTPRVYLLDAFTNSTSYWSMHSTDVYETIADFTYNTTLDYRSFQLASTYSATNFTEKDFVNALFNVIVDTLSTNKSAIINFSGAFRNPTTPTINCAIQWAFHAGHVVVTAAGNSNSNLTFKNPYQFVVGGVEYDRFNSPLLGKVWSGSSFGNSVEIWAPASFRIPDAKVGTSMSTAMVTSAFIQAFNAWGTTLNQDPERAIKFISSLARTDFLSASDPKVAASPNAGRKFLDTSKINSTFPTSGSYLPATLPNYCGALGLPLKSKSWEDWNKLTNLADSLKYGDLVTSFGSSYQYCSTATFTYSFCR